MLTLPEGIQNEVAECTVPQPIIRNVLKLKDESAQCEMLDAYKDGGTRKCKTFIHGLILLSDKSYMRRSTVNFSWATPDGYKRNPSDVDEN